MALQKAWKDRDSNDNSNNIKKKNNTNNDNNNSKVEKEWNMRLPMS